MELENLKFLGPALASMKSLADIATTITNAKLRQEMNDKIADLQRELLTARQQMLEMQEKYERILQENRQFKEMAVSKVSPQRKWGCYVFEGEDGLFCTACTTPSLRKFEPRA